jgi:hypothetical protein
MNNKSKYCYIVAATQTYLPELVVNLNSLDYVGNQNDVHLIGIELSEDFLSQLNKLSYSVIHHNITEEEWQKDRGRSETVCRKRYYFAAEVGQKYDAVCILDADLVWVRDPKLYFDIAAKTGFILGPCKEQCKTYGLEDDHHLVDDKWIWNIPRGFYNENDLCNCPVFLDAKIWGEALKMSWDVFINHGFKAPDMDAMSLSFLQYGSQDKTILLAGNQWLGTNEQHLKPYIRVIENHGKIQTESGIPLFSYHGQYYIKKWRDCQLSNRHHCSAGYLKADRNEEVINNLDGQASGAMNLLYTYFLKMLDYKIIIEKKNYRHPELEYEG